MNGMVLSMGLGLLCLLSLLVTVVAAVVVVVVTRRRQDAAAPSALGILKERYARGEISAEVYERIKRELE